MLTYLLLGATLVVLGSAQLDRDTIINNVVGYKMERPPTYLIVAPRKIRPDQVIQVFATILRLEYDQINVRVSIVKDNVEYTRSMLRFDRPGSRIMQLHMPQNAQAGTYRLRAEGLLHEDSTVYVFQNETDIIFSPKQASVFIQLSKPIYRQGQKVFFRVIPIKPSLLPKYGSLTIYVNDPTGFPVRRWLGLQTNAGGIVSQSFELSDQPNYGNWSIQVDAFGFSYYQHFLVEEFWDPRFDVNVTVAPYIMDNVDPVRGIVLANVTTGKGVQGNATVTLTVKPPPDQPGRPSLSRNQNMPLPQLSQQYNNFHDVIYFEFTMADIWREVHRVWPLYTSEIVWQESPGRLNTLENFELVFNVSVTDYWYKMQRTGYASTMVFSSRVKLKWVGDGVRTFKPDSFFKASVAVMNFDGTPVTGASRPVIFTPMVSHTQGGGSAQGARGHVAIKGIADFSTFLSKEAQSIRLVATYDGDQRTRIEMRATRYFSPSNSYISVWSSTKNPMVNEYMIFHVRTSNFIPRFYYQVIASGNIIVGEELEMISQQKTFSVALSSEMVPTARLVVYYLETTPEEIVIDTLNFFVNGTRSNLVKATVNKGKDFTRDTIEINAYADPGAYVAFSTMPNDIYVRGMDDGLTENKLIDELSTYDAPARGAYRHLWRLSESEYEYKFFATNSFGIDANSTFRDAGLIALTDVNVNRVENMCADEENYFPCFTGGTCYHINETCNGVYNCPNDWADEQNCPQEDPRYNNITMGMISRVSRVLRFYEDSSWLWKEYFIKPDGRVDFRVEPPKYPLGWVINGISMSPTLGLGIIENRIKYDATRYMYIIVEAPEVIVRGEQIGVRVSVFNYWYNDDFIEVIITMHGSPDYNSVMVGDLGIVSSYKPEVHSGSHQTIVFLEPGESKDIYMPLVSTMIQGQFNFTVSAWCFIERDIVSRTVHVKPDGVMNYYNIPYLIDMITYGSILIPDFDVPVPEQFVTVEVREHKYIPYSPTARLSIFGDVVTPGFFEEYLTAEDILWKPYGGGEMNMFNFAYNLLTLKFKKANQQLDNNILKRSLRYLNIALQRQLSYMNEDGSFRMFRDDHTSSIWLTAFVAKTLNNGRFGEWERDLFIPLELINKMVVWMCGQQNDTGAFMPDTNSPVYDRIFTSLFDQRTKKNMFADPIPLTSYLLITLHSIQESSGDALNCIAGARSRAAHYLSSRTQDIIDSAEPFHLAISAYALALSQQQSTSLFEALWNLKRYGEESYFADIEVPPNPTGIINTVRYLEPRQELANDGYAVQTTAYALMAHIKHNSVSQGANKNERDSLMRWLQSMRNFIGGFASTQDTLLAMEALVEFTIIDPNRNEFDMLVQLESSATPNWRQMMFLTKDNYTNMQDTWLPKVFGTVRVTAHGTGRALMQLTTTKNVEYNWLLKPTQNTTQFFTLEVDNFYFSGRNFSVFEMTTCVSWIYTEKSKTSGLTVLEIDLPTGYIIMNDTLRAYVQSASVPNLKRAEMYWRKVVFYFSYLDTSKSCVYFRADRWYPVANMTIQHRYRVYDYYEPGMHNTSIYTTYNLFNLNICYVCGSYQCPYCPFFNVATVLKASFTLLSIVLGFLVKRYALRIT